MKPITPYQLLDGFEINRRRLAVKIAENRNDNKKPQNRSSFNSNQRRESNYSAKTNNENEEKAGQFPPSDYNKPENRKKSSKSKKRNFDTDSDRAKKTKMPAHKKVEKTSGISRKMNLLKMTYFHLTMTRTIC